MDDFDEGPAPFGRKMSSGERDTLRLDADRRGADGERSEQDAEARMRQALSQFGQRSAPTDNLERRASGSTGGHTPARRHRFVQDGEVQVSVVRPRRDTPTAAGASPRLAEARERALDEQAAERVAREQLERRLAEAQTTIRTLQTRLGHAELERDEAFEAARALREELAAERATAEERRIEKSRTRTVRESADEEPEPVKWWL